MCLPARVQILSRVTQRRVQPTDFCSAASVFRIFRRAGPRYQQKTNLLLLRSNAASCKSNPVVSKGDEHCNPTAESDILGGGSRTVQIFLHDSSPRLAFRYTRVS